MLSIFVVAAVGSPPMMCFLVHFVCDSVPPVHNIQSRMICARHSGITRSKSLFNFDLGKRSYSFESFHILICFSDMPDIHMRASVRWGYLCTWLEFFRLIFSFRSNLWSCGELHLEQLILCKISFFTYAYGINTEQCKSAMYSDWKECLVVEFSDIILIYGSILDTQHS